MMGIRPIKFMNPGFDLILEEILGITRGNYELTYNIDHEKFDGNN